MLMRPQALYQALIWKGGSPIGFILQFRTPKVLGSIMNATLQYHRNQDMSKVGMSGKAVIDIPNIRTKLFESFGNVKPLMMQFT